MKRKIFSTLFALVLACSLSLVTAVPASAAGTPTIDGTVSSGEWDGAVEIPVAGGMGTVKLLARTDYLYVLFDVTDSTDARLGENIHGNDQTSININPTEGAPWGLPCDIIFQIGADPGAWGGTSSGTTNGWETDWEIDGTQLLSLPPDLETMTVYDAGTRISEWKLPLASIAPSAGDTLQVGGAIDVGDGNSYVYPIGLDWGDVATYVDYSFIVENETTGLYYQTIQDAIDSAAEGDTVNVVAGTYVGNLILDVPNLTLKSVEKHGAVIQTEAGFNAGSGYGGITVLAAGVTIDGFKIVQGVVQAIIHTHDSHNVTIKNNRIVSSDDARPRGIDVGYAPANSNFVAVEGNEFHELYCGVYVNRGEDLTVEGNYFEDMVDGAIVFEFPLTDRVLVKNNEAQDAGHLLYFWTIVGSVIAEGNTLVNTELSNYGVYNTEQNKYFDTIQAAINAASPSDTILVYDGTYYENVTINKTLTLLSASGREDTTIQGDQALGVELGTVFVTNNTDGVQIGDIGQGFTISGIDGPPGLEKAAVYFQGDHSNAVIKGNNVVANGDAGLLTEWGATITGFVISDNEFSGQTFLGDTPGGEGFGQQFTEPNVPRQLANMGGGSGGGNTSDITFTDNRITGTAGGINSENNPQGNTLVTIDSAGSTITGNVFEGTTTRYGSSLRARGPNATITGNDFKSTGLTLSNGHLYLENNPIDSALIAANTFDKGVYVESASGGTIGLSIQGFVSAVPSGTIINVLAGLYNERLTINTSLDLHGARYGVDPTPSGARTTPADESIITEAGLPTPNPDVLIEIPAGVLGVTVDGFTLDGDQTNTVADTSVVRIWGDNATISNNIIDGMFGVIYKGGDTLAVHQNRMVVNKVGVAVQPDPATNVTISDNVITLGSNPVGDEQGIYMTGCSQSSVTGNTITGFIHNAALAGSHLDHLTVSGNNTFTGNAAGVSIWGTSTFITITGNVLSDSLIYANWDDSGCGISIKGADLVIAGNQIANNADKGVKIDYHQIATERVTISQNNIVGNTNYGVWVNTQQVTEIVDATLNWWGNPNGPGAAAFTSIMGTYPVGDAVSVNVDYSPWLPGEWEDYFDPVAEDFIDSDGDGFSDLEEYWLGTDPNDPESLPGATIDPDEVDNAYVEGDDPGEVNLEDSEGDPIADVDISGGGDASGTITGARYTKEPEEETGLSIGTGTTGVAFLDIKVTGYTEGIARITVPYPDVAPDDGIVDGTSIHETTLSLYYWDEATSTWLIADNNVVDTVNNNVSGDIPVSALAGTPVGMGGYLEDEAAVAIESILNLSYSGEDTVYLTIDTNTAFLGAATIDLTFDPRVVEVIAGENSAFDTLTVNLNYAVIGNDTQIARFVAHQEGEAGVDATGGVVVAVVKLNAVGSTMDESPLALDLVTLKDNKGDTIPFTLGANDSIAIVGGIGDANRDGVVDSYDCVYIARAIAGFSGYSIDTPTMNVSGDLTVDAWDCTYLARHLVGIAGYEQLGG